MLPQFTVSSFSREASDEAGKVLCLLVSWLVVPDGEVL